MIFSMPNWNVNNIINYTFSCGRHLDETRNPTWMDFRHRWRVGESKSGCKLCLYYTLYIDIITWQCMSPIPPNRCRVFVSTESRYTIKGRTRVLKLTHGAFVGTIEAVVVTIAQEIFRDAPVNIRTYKYMRVSKHIARFSEQEVQNAAT